MSFPVYRLSLKKPLEQDGVLYYSNTYKNIDDNTLSTHIKLVDDKNIKEDTLSRRRLSMQNQGAPLYPLRKAAFFLGDFIKLAKSGYWFIDTYGKLFTYKKATRAKLTFHKIKKVIPGKATGSILEVEGIPNRFKTLYIVKDYMKYAGILEYNGISILYGVYDRPYKESWRMI